MGRGNVAVAGLDKAGHGWSRQRGARRGLAGRSRTLRSRSFGFLRFAKPFAKLS